MCKFRVETKLKKYEKINNKEFKAYSVYSLMGYLSRAYNFSQFSLNTDHKKGKLGFVLIGKV